MLIFFIYYQTAGTAGNIYLSRTNCDNSIRHAVLIDKPCAITKTAVLTLCCMLCQIGSLPYTVFPNNSLDCHIAQRNSFTCHITAGEDFFVIGISRVILGYINI